MSFFTSLVYYRPAPPPLMTADDLSRFVSEIYGTNTLGNEGLRSLRVKYGDSIDQDDKPTSWVEQTDSVFPTMQSLDWDLELKQDPTHQDIIDALSSDDRRIYRAEVTLGMPIHDVLDPITRENSPENAIDYHPDQLSIEIGPIECYCLVTEQPVHVGWISLEISGGGYLFPWTLREAYIRLNDVAAIRELTTVCRSFWPVTPDPPAPHIVDLRKQVSEIWPYDRFDMPWDWYWGLRESG